MGAGEEGDWSLEVLDFHVVGVSEDTDLFWGRRMAPWPRGTLTSPEQQGHQTTVGGPGARPLTQLLDRKFLMYSSNELFAYSFIHLLIYL